MYPEEAHAFRAWQDNLSSDTHLIVFSDGSKTSTSAVGGGYAIYWAKKKIAQGKGRLGIAEVFEAKSKERAMASNTPYALAQGTQSMSASTTPQSSSDS
ncbi:hypothetical protein MKZ38_002425 [Zalerion maritima]|uniref:Uncharacterized protein n=1 Tax=Zalerion maritima TaxID=339359 RepID=A0AAD5RQB4_9PEZI|nr:hypothetical protein MKZ38_002425 [Zalerion maritima]